MKKSFKNHLKTLLALILVVGMLPISGLSALAADKNTQPVPNSYRTVTEIYDWGAAITKVIVYLGERVTTEAISTDTFSVHVVRTDIRPKTMLMGTKEGDRKIIKAYPCNKNGDQVRNGVFIALEMEVGPEVSLASPLNFSLTTYLNDWIKCDYTITQKKDITAISGKITGVVANVYAGGIRKVVDDFTLGKSSYDGITLTYASYAMKKSKEKYPLIIWLHGMGEGGTDATLPISANKACNFASEEMQAYFGGAYVLAPQAPTWWMDGIKGFGDGTSKYEKALMALIKDYVAANKGIDTNRIYIGGDSNGGYMTMLMIRDYKDYFAAAFPTCEALMDKLITDADIQGMKNIPIWFTAAKTDTTVPPTDYVVPTYDRLLKAGATNVHFTYLDKVIDTTGLYKKPDGTPYEYGGHNSWIYVYNNECTANINGKTITLMEWLASQKLSKGK